jgi:hypothetical protein
MDPREDVGRIHAKHPVAAEIRQVERPLPAPDSLAVVGQDPAHVRDAEMRPA